MTNYAMQQRQEWIKNRYEPFRRSDLMAEFKITTATASSDIKTYKKNGGVLLYDLNNKHYVKPNYITPRGQ